ncbi:MAG: imidazole glycerol phosphate synthase subunit HisH [Desulfobacterota bacterium]|nr:imidazole glycerol phosphate synthase subunit HisH [Thermodesulfobacteriota bacterium]
MKPKIAIVDYGMGNLRSVQKAFERVGFEAHLAHHPREIQDASAIVLPGVGAFRDAMENLRRFGFIEPILRSIEGGKPYLGICLGLQILFTESEEFGPCRGLDLVKGRVVRFRPDGEHKVPHMGWNSIEMRKEAPPLRGVESGSYVYFVHSYYVLPEEEEWVSTLTPYGVLFASSISKENIFATQFHPEKSQRIGLKILENFVKSI